VLGDVLHCDLLPTVTRQTRGCPRWLSCAP
jgi:hypothetical protein